MKLQTNTLFFLTYRYELNSNISFILQLDDFEY